MLKSVYAKGVFLSLGSNVGNRRSNILRALTFLNRSAGIRVVKVSSLYATKPWGYQNQRMFLNAVVEVRTVKNPHALLESLLKVERRLGRYRRTRWGPRTLDIDILIYNRQRVNKRDLTIPHKYITERLFVLIPLAELDPAIRLNGFGIVKLIERLLKRASGETVGVYRQKTSAGWRL